MVENTSIAMILDCSCLMLFLLPSPTNHQRPNLLVEVQESEYQLVSAYNVIPILRRHRRLEGDQCFHPLDRKVDIYPNGADPGVPGDCDISLISKDG
jgi:hypothetical protein